MKRRALTLALLLSTQLSLAATEATTADGRKVLLRDNGTWTFVREGAEEDKPMARLELENRVEIPNGCRLGLRMSNNLNAQIRTLVLRFTAFKAGDIPFETVSRGYSFIKPTTDQYQEIRFRGISCEQIDKVLVRAAHNCHIGELTKYNASEDRCLELVDVRESELMTIFKKPVSAEQQTDGDPEEGDQR